MLYIQDTPLKSILLKAVPVIPVLLPQKPSKYSKAKDNVQALERRIKLRDEGNIEGLLYEGMTIQQRSRSNKKAMTIAKISLTHFWPMFPFYTPWKHQKTKVFWFSGVFRGYKMGTLVRNGLKFKNLTSKRNVNGALKLMWDNMHRWNFAIY